MSPDGSTVLVRRLSVTGDIATVTDGTQENVGDELWVIGGVGGDLSCVGVR